MTPPFPTSDDAKIPAASAGSVPASIPPSTPEDPGDSPRWLAVYVIVKHPGRPPYWLSVGKAFVNTDGSLNVRLDANPIDGKLHIRRPPLREPAGAASQPATENSTDGATENATTWRSRTDARPRPLFPKRGAR
jgi:hypothetical protein